MNMPPRMIGKLSLFAVEIDSWFHWLGLNHHLLDFTYQGVIINGAVLLYHWAFSFVFDPCLCGPIILV